MPSAVEQTRAIQAKAIERTEQAVRGGLLAVGERFIEISPIGDPTLWKSSPPADYRPGTFISNWNYSRDAIDFTISARTDVREVNGLREAPGPFVGHIHYASNSLPYANALNLGHSSQTASIMPIIEIEAPGLAEAASRKAAQ
jgi:lysozyme family protein